VGDYTDCDSYKQLVEKYNGEKQKALDGNQKIGQELEAINEKIFCLPRRAETSTLNMLSDLRGKSQRKGK
jgi:hypothetical protein